MSYVYGDFKLQENNEVVILGENVRIRINPIIARKLSEKTGVEVEMCKIFLAVISYSRRSNAWGNMEGTKKVFERKLSEENILNVLPILMQKVSDIEVIVDKCMEIKYHELLEIFEAENPFAVFSLL